jgi:PAS domain S-box-containing protein
MQTSLSSFNSSNFNNFQQEIILQAPIPIFVVEGADFIITISNKKNLKKWQRTQEEVLGKPLFDVFPEAESQDFKQILTEVFNTGIPFNSKESKAEFYREGILDTAWFDITYQPIRNEVGEVNAIMAMGAEVTAQVLARKKAENSEKELQQMADAMPHLVWRADGEGNITFYNKRVYEYTGLNNDIDKDFIWNYIVHPEDLERTQKAWINAINKKTLYSIQHRIRMKNGLYRWFLSRAFCEENVEQKTIKWFGSSTDVHEQKLYELKIKQTEQFNRTILESNPDCLKVIDREGKIQYMNFNGQCLMEIDDFKKVKNKLWWELWSEENKDLIENSIQKALSGENVQFVAKSLTAKGNLKWWDVVVSPVNNPNGEIKEILSISRDITLQKQIEDELHKTQERLNAGLRIANIALSEISYVTNTVQLSPKSAAMYGFAENQLEVTRQQMHDTFHPAIKEELEVQINIAMNPDSGGYMNLEHPIVLPSGEVRWLKVNKQFFYDHSTQPAKPVYSILVTQDITERKESEEAIRQSESRYRRIFEHTPLPIWEEDFSEIKNRIDKLSEEGVEDFDDYFATRREELCEYIDTVKIKDVNEASLKLYGCTKDELMVGLRQYYVEETLSDFIKIFQVIAKGGGRFETESIVKNKAGQLLNLLIFIDFPTNKDDYSSVQVIRFDITERKKNEKIIQESEQKYRGLFEQMEQGFCIIEVIFDLENDPIDYRFVESNPMFQQQTGLVNVTGKTISELVPDIEISWSQVYGKVVLTGESTRFIDYSQAMNTWFEVYAFRLGDKTNNKVAILFTNITERKKAELEIKASEEKLRLLTETIPQMVWMTDEIGNTEYLSTQWKKYAGEMPTADYWAMICHPDDSITSLNAWQKSISTGEKFISEIRLKNKEGEYRWHVSVGVPLKNDKDEIIKWIGSVTDIHDQKLKEQKKDEFISIASHEMKTPLTSAKAYLQLMEMTLDENHEAYIYTKKANDAIGRLNKLISELLDASKIQHGKLNYTNSAFNFDTMVADTIENVQYSSISHKIIKKGAVKKQFLGDKDRLQQVVINLLTNAIKYSPNANEVIVEVQQENNHLQVSVIDKGIGMPEKHLEKIFERYYRVEEHSVQFQGLGIGLYISYDIIKRHNGKMWVESVSGEGSTFHFTLPFVN